ncbi:hypothetical protein L3Q82_013141 [Scortum barcoo]|uniref:Uncharacterized protein n=1 Tax=Scortum barcoo TaxID=214431 RepID=A0ACB8VZT9_9TELE|nr:hypothetical protein L3Q82_013141 [Scortum barcoo]
MKQQYIKACQHSSRKTHLRTEVNNEAFDLFQLHVLCTSPVYNYGGSSTSQSPERKCIKFPKCCGGNNDRKDHASTTNSAKREAVLQSAHSEETLGGEEKARDVLRATLLHYGQHQSCSSSGSFIISDEYQSAHSIPGASSSYSDMAVSYEQWSPAPESTLSYYPSHPGTSYSTAYGLPMTSEYGTQQQVPGFGDTMSQTFECPMVAPETGMASPWPLLGPSQSPQLSFGSTMDSTKLEGARMLLNGMDNTRATRQDEDGDTLVENYFVMCSHSASILHIYTAKGLRECAYAAAERLSDLGKLDAKEHKGKTALLVAVTANQPDIVQDLLALGADINACDVKGQTALHLAAHYGLPVVLQAILSSRPAVNLEACNFEGMTPLHCAAISHSVTMKALSSSGMLDVNLQNKATEKLSCVQLLLNAGASLLSQAHGHTALHMAAGLHGNPHQEEILRLLLSRGADPSTRNLENDQPAHLLQSGLQGEQLKLMLKKRSASSRRRIVSLQDQE